MNTPEKISAECLKTVQSTLADLRNEQQEFQRFIDSALGGMEEARVDLVAKDAELDVERQEIADLQVQLAEREETFDANTLELQDTKARLEETESRLKQHVSERDEIQRQLDTTIEELDRMASVLEMLQTTQAELESTQSELSEVRDRLNHQAADAAHKDQQRVDDLERENRELHRQLESTQGELERVNDKVTRQAEQLTSHKTRWTNELRDLRETLQKRKTTVAAPVVVAEPPPHRSAPAVEERPAEILPSQPAPAAEERPAEILPSQPAPAAEEPPAEIPPSQPAPVAEEPPAEAPPSQPAQSAEERPEDPPPSEPSSLPEPEACVIEAALGEHHYFEIENAAEGSGAAAAHVDETAVPDEQESENKQATDPIVGSVLKQFSQLENLTDSDG